MIGMRNHGGMCLRSVGRWMVPAALLVIIVGCGSESATTGETTQQAKLNATCYPQAEVLLDGKSIGKTPIKDHALVTGSHTLEFRRDGFVTGVHAVPEGAGANVDMKLAVEDPKNPDALQALAEDLEIEMSGLEETENFRSGGRKPPVQILYPRGNMRPKDLDQFRIDVTADFELGGAIRFKVRTKTLFEMVFSPDEFETTLGIPDEVSSGAKPGDTVTWGYFPVKGRPVTATFKIVKPDARLDRRMKLLEERLQNQNEIVAAQLRAQLLLNKRFFYAAWRDARNVFRIAESAPQACAIMQAALRGMKLHKSALWTDVSGAVRRLPSRWRRGGVRRR